MLVTVFEIVQVEGFLIKSLVWEAVMKCHCINLKTREAGRQGIASGGCSCLPVFTSTHWYQKILHCSVICTEAVHSFAKTIVSIYQLILGKNLAWFHSYLFPQKKVALEKGKIFWCIMWIYILSSAEEWFVNSMLLYKVLLVCSLKKHLVVG